MTTLVLARHAETVWHAENRYTGRSDIGLTERGREQARTLAAWAARTRPDAVYASDLSRAVRTAEPSAAALGLELRIDADLRELDFGDAEGLTFDEIRQRFPDAAADFLARPATSPLPGGEEPAAAIHRAVDGLERIADAHPDGTVLVVMHSTLLRLVLAACLGFDPNRYRTLFPTVGNCALTTLRWRTPPGCALLGFNVPPQ